MRREISHNLYKIQKIPFYFPFLEYINLIFSNSLTRTNRVWKIEKKIMLNIFIIFVLFLWFENIATVTRIRIIFFSILNELNYTFYIHIYNFLIYSHWRIDLYMIIITKIKMNRKLDHDFYFFSIFLSLYTQIMIIDLMNINFTLNNDLKFIILII